MLTKKSLLPIFIVVLLSACGTTSEIKVDQTSSTNNSENVESTTPKEVDNQKTKSLDLTEYKDVVVLDFSDGTTDNALPTYAGKVFADEIAAAIKKKLSFETIYREQVNKKALLISGEITRYVKGNGTLRFLVGFGAGSSYFDATVRLKDNETGEILGGIDVDKNSWALGGGLAATQTVESFMTGSAETISKRLVDATYGRKVELPKYVAENESSENLVETNASLVTSSDEVRTEDLTTNHPMLLKDLNSLNVKEMRTAAKTIGESKIYDDAALNLAMINILKSATVKAKGNKNKLYIDGVAWCSLNIANTNRREAIPVFRTLREEGYPRKVRNHAIHVLKLWGEL